MKIISALLSLVGGPALSPGFALSVILAAVALFGGGYLKGVASAEADIAQSQRDIAVAYAAEIIARQSVADTLSAENAALRSHQAPKDRIITKEITRYVEITPADQRCTLPGTWRLRHDAAATGTASAAEAGPMANGTADPVEDAAALETLGENYEACRNDQAKLAAWQRRYRALDLAE